MRLPLFAVLLFSIFPLAAQDCFYQLQLRDSGGDGLNGGLVTVTTGTAAPLTFTLDAMNDDGSSGNFFFPVIDGAPVVISYTAGSFPEDVTLTVLKNDDELVATEVAPATSNSLFSFSADCSDCAPPPFTSIEVFRPRYNSVDVRFRSVSPASDPNYLVVYGTDDFDPTTSSGTAITTRDTALRVEGLSTLTDYSFYVATICGASGDTTGYRGPFRISTQRRLDIGVTEIVSPVTACAGQRDGEVTIGITNFGGEAQQFFRVDFTVNGEPSGVQTPFDGIYTGVLGVDSTKFFTFDTRRLLAEPGVYEIKAFTMLEDDEVPENDSVSVLLLTVPEIAEFPYAQTFEDSAGYWYAERAGEGPESWAHGRPTGPVINRAASGEFAYVTNPRGAYNNNELSYLRSPCFNFSELEEDPFLSFNLWVDTEVDFDRLWLEVSTDNGENWRLQERNPSAINWYNNGGAQVWEGDGGLGGGYALVGQTLNGTAGETNVQIRFVFESDGAGRRDGVAIDDIRIAADNDIDLAVVSARVLGESGCSTATDTIMLIFADLGRQRVDSATVNYRIDGGATVSERVAAPGTRGDRIVHRFTPAAIQFLPPAPVEIAVWIEAEGDAAAYNDTTQLVYRPTLSLPFVSDFETGRTPRNWTIGDGLSVGDRSGAASSTLGGRLEAGTAEVSFQTSFYGPVESGDSLFFDLLLGESIGVEASGNLSVAVTTDCAMDSTVILERSVFGNETFSLPLAAFDGESVSFVFVFTQSAGEFFLDFDNVGVKRCPADLDVGLTVVPPTGIFADNGIAFLTPRAGTAPYSYSWNTGDTTQSVDSLSILDYTVLVTDAVGCSQTVTVPVTEEAVATDEAGELLSGLTVFPNPTEGRVEVQFDLANSFELTLELYDARGRRLLQRALGRARSLNTAIDLADRPAGLYLLRAVAGDQVRTVRLIRR